MIEDRFAYEHVQAHFDTYAKKQNIEYQRSYLYFKSLIGLAALCDCAKGDVLRFKARRDLYLSRIWEDVQIAFKGHGEPIWTGAVLQLWSTIPPGTDEQYLSVIQSAFQEAETHTGKGVSRRYAPAVRKKPYRTPEQGLDLKIIYPKDLSRLAEVSFDQGYIPEEYLELFHSFQASKELVPKTVTLKVIKGGK